MIPLPSPSEPVNEIADHPLVGHQRIADRAPALPMTRLSTPVGQSGLGQGLGQVHGAERRQAGRLEDDRVAEGEGRDDLPGRDRDREVPRRDDAADAERLAQGEQQGRWVGRGVVLADRLLDLAGEVAEDRDRAGRLADPFLEGLALFPAQVTPDLAESGWRGFPTPCRGCWRG